MNKELEKEGQEYYESKKWSTNPPLEWIPNAFIAGATSKYVEKKNLNLLWNK